ncbi:hypothetical protein L3Q82_000226 [Scortum barcoo]|uniref:Uncharacterized protein n=1 Tax=Scortum barcoo TaxID=214431 RepID=A0ACB8XAQ6_9TELE|nr:hypothetical protein L3Q82_000226 [Scortum barcoo]
MEREIDRRIGAASAVMRSVYRTVVVKKELSRKARLSIYRSIYVPTLTYGHELWVMTTERTRSADTSGRNEFPPCRVAGRSLRDRGEKLGHSGGARSREPLLLQHREESAEVAWASVSDAPWDASLGRCSRHVPPGGDLGEDPGHAGETMSLGWPGNASGSPWKSWKEVSGVREVWASLLRLLPPRPGPGSSAKMKGTHEKPL